jgi:hypothetical protein
MLKVLETKAERIELELKADPSRSDREIAHLRRRPQNRGRAPGEISPPWGNGEFKFPTGRKFPT